MATHSSILAWRISMDRGAWWATVRGVAKSWTQLSDFSLSSRFFTSQGQKSKRAQQVQPSYPKIAKEEGRKHLIAIAMNRGSGERDKSPYRMRPFKI